MTPSVLTWLKQQIKFPLMGLTLVFGLFIAQTAQAEFDHDTQQPHILSTTPKYNNGRMGMQRYVIEGITTDSAGAIYLITGGTRFEDGTLPPTGRVVLAFKSTDGGTNWQRLSLPNDSVLNLPPESTINLDPSLLFVDSKDAIYACQGAVNRSNDGGQTWKLVFNRVNEACVLTRTEN